MPRVIRFITETYSHEPLTEAYHDFSGLPSNPISIYHTGPAWPLPTGPEAYRIRKEARPVCKHAILSVWDELGEKIYKFFDSDELKWTSIDPVRFAKAGEEAGSLFLWVGVMPGTLSPDHAKDLAVRCKEFLSEYQISDVEIAFRESVYTRYAGPQLLDYGFDFDPTVDVRVPFTPALGLRIASEAFPCIEGTGCLYLCEGGESNRVFLLTARHVVLPPSEYPNESYHYKDKSMPRLEVIQLGHGAFKNALQTITDKMRSLDFTIDYYKRVFEGLGEHLEDEDPQITSQRRNYNELLEKASASKPSVFQLHHDIINFWSKESERILGHVVYAPPISVDTGGSMFAEDWALVELDRSKIDWGKFQGNVIHLAPSIPTQVQIQMKMYPHAESRPKLDYWDDGLMQLQDFVEYDDLCRPTALDANGEECLIVVKNGTTTGVTLGRASGIKSFVREYKDYVIHTTSRQIAVYPYSHKDGAFSAPGDSGSVVADRNRRIVGMITGGAGLLDETDVTYVSAYAFLDKRIKEAFPHYHLYPIRDPT